MVTKTQTKTYCEVPEFATMRTAYTSCYLCMLVCLAALSVHADSKKSFPFVKGNYWVYKGYTMDGRLVGDKWQVDYVDLGEGLRIKSLDSFHAHGIDAALLDGFPMHPGFEDGDASATPKARAHYVMVRWDDGNYVVTKKNADAVFELLRNAKDPKSVELVPEIFWVKDRGIKLGMKDYEVGDAQRTDDWYCWVLTREAKIRLPILDDPHKTYDAYTYEFLVNGSEEALEFVPAIGIIKYDFSHHGSLGEEHIKLVNYGQKNSQKEGKDK